MHKQPGDQVRRSRNERGLTQAELAGYSKVAQATIASTICVKGWTKTIRPKAGYTNALKKAQLALWHYADQTPRTTRRIT